MTTTAAASCLGLGSQATLWHGKDREDLLDTGETAFEGLGSAQLTSLIQDLFEFSKVNQDFMVARFLRDTARPLTLKPYLARIKACFYRRRGQPVERLNLKDGRAAVREYRKATLDADGTLDLMLAYVETGTRFTLDFGDIDGPFYDSLISMLYEIQKMLEGEEGERLYGLMEERLDRLHKAAAGIGWGYGDTVAEIVGELRDRSNT